MKRTFKLTLTIITVLSIIFSCFSISVGAANNYVANWGERGEVATSLSSYAVNFYNGDTTYNRVSKLSGGATESAVPSSALYKELQNIMKSAQTYTTSYNATKSLFKYTDCLNGNTSKISSFYSGTLMASSWGSGWNREHTWPNSKGDASGSGENDIMMLRPTASSENGSRGNKAYGESSGYYNPNSESNGKYDLRGDCARIVLYTYVRWNCTNTGSKYNPNGIFGKSGVIENLTILLKWIEEDPVDTWELGRNDAVQSITGTRNIFVDYPELAWQLFGKALPSGMITPSQPNGTVGGGNPVTPDVGGTDTTPDTPVIPEPEIIGETEYRISAEGKNAKYYFNGIITGGRLGVTTNKDESKTIFAVQTADGYYLYYTKNGAKQYIVLEDDAAGVSTVSKITSATMFNYNEAKNTFAVKDTDNNRAFAINPSDSTIMVFSAFKIDGNFSDSYSFAKWIVAGSEDDLADTGAVDAAPDGEILGCQVSDLGDIYASLTPAAFATLMFVIFKKRIIK